MFLLRQLRGALFGAAEEHQQQEHGKAHRRNGCAQAEGLVAVDKADGVGALAENQANHAPANQHRLPGLSVHLGIPVAVLGDGGIQQTIPGTVDGALYLGIGEGGELQLGTVEHFIAQAEQGIVHNCHIHRGAAILPGLAHDADVNHIPGLHILDGQHLGQTDVLPVQLHTVDTDIEGVALGQIQPDTGEAVLGHHIGIDYASAGDHVAVAAVAVLPLLHHLGTAAIDIPVFQGNGLPHVPGQAGGRPEQLILEGKGAVAGEEIHLGQLGLRHEAQRQVGGIAVQVHIAEMVHLLEAGAAAVPAVPVNHIFQAQKQVGHRGALLEAIAVIGVLGPVAQGPHKLGNVHIGRAGEGGDAGVAVQCAIVQGLGVGDLCPVEGGIGLPLLHIANHRGGLLRALGVIHHIGAGEIEAEGRQGGGQLQGHHGADAALGGSAPAAGLPANPERLLRGILPGLGPEGSQQQNQEIQGEEAYIIYNVYMHIPPGSEQQDALGLHGVPAAAQQRHCQQPCGNHLQGLELPPHQPGPVGHHQQHKAIQEAEPVGNHIGEMEAVPDIVQLPQDKAHVEKQQQQQGAQLVPPLDIPGQQEEDAQQNAAHAAVQIGKPLFEAGLDAAAHIPRHLAHGIQQTHQVIFGGDVQPEAGGKFVHAGLGGSQGGHGRHGQKGAHAQGQNGEQGNPQQVAKEPLPPPGAADFIAEEAEEHKDAYEKSDIVIGNHGQGQCQGIQGKFPLPQQPHHSQHYQGQQGKGIQPHHIPLVAQRPGAQGIEAAE